MVREIYVYRMKKAEFLRLPANAFPLKSDLALLQMDKPWIFNDQTNVYPACLMDFERYFFGGKFLAAGYGQTVPLNLSKPLNQTALPESQFSPTGKGKLLITKFKPIEIDVYLLGLSNPQSSMCFGNYEHFEFTILFLLTCNLTRVPTRLRMH